MLSTPAFAVPLFENARVRISDHRLPAKTTTTFEHTFPSVRWQVDPGVHSLGDGPPTPVADKAVSFMEAGTTWVCRNEGDARATQAQLRCATATSDASQAQLSIYSRKDKSSLNA